MRIFAIYGFVVNRDIVIFFDGPLLVSWLGQEVKNDMSDQYTVSLGVCNVKIRKFLTGAKRGSFSRCFGLRALALRDLNFFSWHQCRC